LPDSFCKEKNASKLLWLLMITKIQLLNSKSQHVTFQLCLHILLLLLLLLLHEASFDVYMYVKMSTNQLLQ
jgi:hypothetical protein